MPKTKDPYSTERSDLTSPTVALYEASFSLAIFWAIASLINSLRFGRERTILSRSSGSLTLTGDCFQTIPTPVDLNWVSFLLISPGILGCYGIISTEKVVWTTFLLCCYSDSLKMNLHSSIPDAQFDSSAFEQERAEILARTLRVGVEYAACDAAFPPTEKSFSSEKYSSYSPEYADGEWDAKMSFEPSAENWISADYQCGYVAGIVEKYNDQFAQLI